MAKITSIQEGDVLFDCHTYRMGNTTMRAMGCWDVVIKSIDLLKKTARVSWNGNPEQTYYEHNIERLRRHPPEWLRDPLNGSFCHCCGAKKEDGHRDGCKHPKAKWRKVNNV